MTDDKPRKTLSLKRKAKPKPDVSEEIKAAVEVTKPSGPSGEEVKEFTRGRKRVIKMKSMAQKKAEKDSLLSPSERQSRELSVSWPRPFQCGVDDVRSLLVLMIKSRSSLRAKT